MQYRVYDRRTLKYVDGGYVMSYEIDDDYIVNNNSTITVCQKSYPSETTSRSHEEEAGTYTYYLSADYRISQVLITTKNASVTVDSFVGNSYTLTFAEAATVEVLITYTNLSKNANQLANVVVGDIVVLIETAGAFHKGVITAVDDTALTISYKGDKELFNDNMVNPLSEAYANYEYETTVTPTGKADVAGKFGIDVVVALFQSMFVDIADDYKALPITFQTVGDVLDDDGEVKMFWTWDDDSINLVDWLVELFEKYNLSMSFTIDFNTAEDTLADRQPSYIVTFSATTNAGGIIKDNVDLQTITYTEEEVPDATVCHVISSDTKEYLKTYYLYENNGNYFISTDSDDSSGNRVLPVKTVITTYNTSETELDEYDAAYDELIPSQFNQAIEIKVNSDSKMFDFENAQFGDLYKIINERGTIDSIYTGKKISSNEKWVTLYFGLGRQRYTDLIQIRLRKSKYTKVYNQSSKVSE